MESRGNDIICPSYRRFAGLFRGGTWLSTIRKGQKGTMVWGWWCEAIIWGICFSVGVRISTVVEEGRVAVVPVSAPSASFPGPSSLHVFPGKAKRKKGTRISVHFPGNFETARFPELPPKTICNWITEQLGFGGALERQEYHATSKRNGRNRRATFVFQMELPWFSQTAFLPEIAVNCFIFCIS